MKVGLDLKLVNCRHGHIFTILPTLRKSLEIFPFIRGQMHYWPLPWKAASRLQGDAYFCGFVFILVTATRQTVVFSVGCTMLVLGKRPSFWALMFFLWRSPITADGPISCSPSQPACWFAAQCGRIPARSGCTPEIRRWGLGWACMEPRVEWLLRSLKSLSLNTLGTSSADVTISSKVGHIGFGSFFFK